MQDKTKLSMNQKWFTAKHHESKIPITQEGQNAPGSQERYPESEAHEVNFTFLNSVLSFS